MDEPSLQHFLYIIDYWITFPSSEYGGIVIVTATSDEDAWNVLRQSRWEHELPEDLAAMKKAVTEAKRYELKGSHKSEIVEMMLT